MSESKNESAIAADESEQNPTQSPHHRLRANSSIMQMKKILGMADELLEFPIELFIHLTSLSNMIHLEIHKQLSYLLTYM